MRKSKFMTLCKRTMAVVLAFMMMLTTFVDGSFVSYATSEESTLEYAGTEEGNELHISYFDFTDSFPFSEENVLAILNSKTATYDSIYIQYPDQTVTSVSAELWNAAVKRLNPDYEDRSVRYEFISDDSYNMTWYFNKPVITDAEVTMQADITFGSSMTVNYASTTFPAEFSGLNLRTKSTKSDYAMISALFGTETMELEYVDAAGNVITDCGRYEVSTWSDGETEVYYSHIQMRPLSRLTAGTTYTLQESVYKGEINTWTNGDGSTGTSLYIGAGAFKGWESAMTAQEILDILAYHEGTAFDAITIEQPASGNVIYKDVVNGAIDYLKTTGNQNITWILNDYQNSKSSFQWVLRVPSQMSADQAVSQTITADADNAPYIMIGDYSNLNAESIGGYYWTNIDNTDAGFFREYLGDSSMEISVGDSGKNGYYGVNDSNVWINFYDLSGLTADTKYTLAKKVYAGYEWTNQWNGSENFEINHNEVTGNGETFNDTTILNILNKKAQAGATYHRVYFIMPAGTTSVSADVWNAAVGLLKEECEENQQITLQIGIDGEDSHNTNWTFVNPVNTDEAVTLNVNMDWSSDRSGVEVSFPRVTYPADAISMDFDTNTGEKTDASAFINAFGSESIHLEVVDTDGNAVEGTDGNYNVEDWGDDVTGYNVHIGNIMRLTPDTTYRVQEYVYKGEVGSWENNGVTYYQLNINPWSAGKNGAAFSKDELIAILQANAGKEYAEIYIDQAYSSENIIYKDVVNEALNILDQDDWNKINFNFVNYDTGYGYGVGLENPSAMTADQVVSFELGLDDDKATVTINNTFSSVNAEWVNIHSFMPYDSEMGTVYREIYGEDRYGLILEETGHSAYYEANEDSVWFDVYNMADLEKGTYTFAAEDYKGDGFGNGEYSYLNIDWRRFADYGQEYSEEAVIAILEEWAAIGEQFNGVHITYPSKDSTVVSKEVWNTAAALVKEDTDGRYEETPYLSIIFNDYETYGVEWRMQQPWETDADVNLKATVTFSTDGSGVGLKFAKSDYPAPSLDYIIYTNTHRTDVSLFTGAFGDVQKDIRLSLKGKATGVEGGYWVEYGSDGTVSYSIGLSGVQGLKANTAYQVEEKPYTGRIESWIDMDKEVTCLNINPWDAGKNGEKLSDEFILEVLSRNEGKLYDQIYVEQPASDSNVISAAVVNAAMEYLKPDGEKLLKFGFMDYETGTGNEIWLSNPTEQAADQVVTAHVALNEEGIPYLYAGALADLGSDYISLWHSTPAEGEEGAALAEYFEFSRAIAADGTKLEGDFNINDDQVWLCIGNLLDLEADQNYTLVNKVYKGDVEGDNQEFLSIYWWQFENTGDGFCDETVLNILQERAAEGSKYDQVFIGYPSQDITAVPMDIWNAAVALLNEVTEDRTEVTLQIGLENGESYDYYWTFRNPVGVEEDVQLGQPEFSLVTGLGMLISFDRNEFPAGKTIYQISTQAKRDELINTFGEEEMWLDVVRNEPKALVEADTRGYYGVDDWSAWVMVGDVAALDVNTRYQVQEHVYRGEIFDDGRSLDIWASELGKATVTVADLGNIVGYYHMREMVFDHITIYQDYTKNNVISKSVINYLRNILNPEGGELRFVFDRSEATENNYFVNEVSWSLYAPQEAVKDINANITFTTTANQGAVIKFNANDYAAEQVFVSLHTDRNSTFGAELAAGLGEAPVFIEGEPEPDSRLAALKKGTELVEYAPIHYQNYDGHIYLDIVEVRELTAGVNYTLLQRKLVEDTMEVGVPYDMTKQLTYVPDGKVTWKSFTQDVADITAAGVFTAANEGEFYVMATYKSAGKTYKEMLCGEAAIVLKSIAFENAKMELELYPDVYDNSNFVKVLTYPANAYVDPNELEWSVTGDDILILGDGGNFIAAGLGTAVITATVPGTDISASCEVKVIEYTRISDEVSAALDELYIVTNFDTTLADIELPAGCEWKEPATKLNTYVGLISGTFPIMYTASNGRTIELTWDIPIMTIKDIYMYLANTDAYYFKRGEEHAVFAYYVDVENGTFEDIKNHKAFDSLIVKPTGMVSTAVVSEYAEDYPDCFVLKTTESTKTGKTTLKLDLVYKGKSIANDSYVIYVTKDYAGDFEGFSLGVEDDNDGNANTAILVLKFTDANYYFKPTVKCNDTSILKLGKFTYPTAAEIEAAKADGTALEIRIPYTEVKAGDAGIEITLADEVKSKRTYIYTVFDRQPKALEQSFTINTEYDFKKAPISIQYTDYYGIHPDYSETPVVVMDDRFQFDYYRFDSETGRVYGWLEIKEGASVKNGTYSVKLYTPVDVTFDKENLEITDEELLASYSEQYVTVKVKVSNAKPSVTVKQTEKVNMFFDQSAGSESFMPEGSGELLLTTKNGYVKDVSMTGTNDFELVPWGGYYVIYYKPDNDGVVDKTATLTYSVIDYDCGLISNQTKNITIATVNKAPSVKLTQKSDTLYPGYGTSMVYLYNGTSGKFIQIDEISWVKSTKEIIPLSLDEEGTFISTAKSDYLVNVNGARVDFNLIAGKNTTDKIKLRIKQDEWSKPIDVTYSITTKWTAPKLKLTSSKLTLNVNEEVYQSQVAGAYLLLDGYQSLPYGLNVRFTGADAKSKAVLNDQIMLSYEYDQIVARFNIDPKDTTRPSGSYKFKVWVDNGIFESSTTFTVNVVNQPVAKNVKLTKSGSIDVLRRDTTCLTYKPKLTNLSGWIVGATLTGADSDKFYAEWSWWNSGINVYAYEGVELSTSVNYKLAFQLEIQNEDGSVYYITTPIQSVKVTQSKPKVTLDSYEGTALYTQAGNTLTTGIEAALKNEYIEIENVTLANYNYDLALNFDKDNQRFTLHRQGWYEITKSGKVWSLKLNVTFVDQAGNVKDTQVTYKVKVQ